MMKVYIVLVLTSTLCSWQVLAGYLGKGEGLGSCAAAPFRAYEVQWTYGCPAFAPCCSEYGFCRPLEEWEYGKFRDCNGVSNGTPLPLETQALEASAPPFQGKPAGKIGPPPEVLRASYPGKPYHPDPHHPDPYHPKPHHADPYHPPPPHHAHPAPHHGAPHHPTPHHAVPHHPAPPHVAPHHPNAHHAAASDHLSKGYLPPVNEGYHPDPYQTAHHPAEVKHEAPYAPPPPALAPYQPPHVPEPAPYHPTPESYHPTPVAYHPTPAPYHPTPAPYHPTPVPYHPTPAPYHPTPEAYPPPPVPYHPTPEPYNKPTPAPYLSSPTPPPYIPPSAPAPYSPPVATYKPVPTHAPYVSPLQDYHHPPQHYTTPVPHHTAANHQAQVHPIHQTPTHPVHHAASHIAPVHHPAHFVQHAQPPASIIHHTPVHAQSTLNNAAQQGFSVHHHGSPFTAFGPAQGPSTPTPELAALRVAPELREVNQPLPPTPTTSRPLPAHFLTTLAPLASTSLDTMMAEDSNVMEMTSAEQREPKALNDNSFIRFNNILEDLSKPNKFTPTPFTSTEGFRSAIASTTPTPVIFPTPTPIFPLQSPSTTPKSSRPLIFTASTTTPRPSTNQNIQSVTPTAFGSTTPRPFTARPVAVSPSSIPSALPLDISTSGPTLPPFSRPVTPRIPFNQGPRGPALQVLQAAAPGNPLRFRPTPQEEVRSGGPIQASLQPVPVQAALQPAFQQFAPVQTANTPGLNNQLTGTPSPSGQIQLANGNSARLVVASPEPARLGIPVIIGNTGAPSGASNGICNYQNRGGSYACLSFGSPHKPIFSYHHILGDPSKLSPVTGLIGEGIPEVFGPNNIPGADGTGSRIVRRRRKSKHGQNEKEVSQYRIAKKYQDMVIKSLPLQHSGYSPEFQNNFIDSVSLDGNGQIFYMVKQPIINLPSKPVFEESMPEDLNAIPELLPSTSTIFVTPAPQLTDGIILNHDEKILSKMADMSNNKENMIIDTRDMENHSDEMKVNNDDMSEKEELSDNIEVDVIDIDGDMSNADLNGLFDYIWKNQDDASLNIPMSEDLTPASYSLNNIKTNPTEAHARINHPRGGNDERQIAANKNKDDNNTKMKGGASKENP